ncbi:DUF4326 domain-containing protein [Cryobacterium cryoconiti]|uniref:DUF4326 domain-containing protein n=1 Tax=Cryobacterium cryoconiti TaxID=1259239 RepID=A0A4Y8JXY9_9MICO|nr:DUF4326 domain-containing protein [Cryobacterium cryoconiti]TFD27465.1 DUF4326 domain-containing protein [Cryobacterium cryoconiti]
MPKRIQMTRNRPWRVENPDAVVVDRRTRWGNPFAVGKESRIQRHPALVSMPSLAGTVVPRDRAEAVRLFGYLFRMPRVIDSPGYYSESVVLEQLRGKDLACWCPLDQPCHADVLLKIANEGN